MYFIYKYSFENGKSYIGKTGDIKRRNREHREAKSLIGNALRKYKEKYSFEIIDQSENEAEAYLLERYYIEQFDTIVPKGYNLDSGGRGGTKKSKETIEKFKKTIRRMIRSGERIVSKETKKKIQNSLLKYYEENPEARELCSTRAKEAMNRPDVKKKCREAKIGYIISEETIRKIIERRRKTTEENGYYFSDSSIQKIRDSLSDKPKSEEHRKNIGKSLKGREPWNKGKTKETDASLASASEKLVGRRKSKETIEKMKEGQKVAQRKRREREMEEKIASIILAADL